MVLPNTQMQLATAHMPERRAHPALPEAIRN